MSYLSYANKYAYAPYKFKPHNLIMHKDMKGCYFLVEFYFLVGFLEKKLPLKIVQFIFAIVKKKQKILRALHIANRASWAYLTMPSVMDYQTHFENLVLGTYDPSWRPKDMNVRLACLMYSDKVNLADEVNQAQAEVNQAQAKKTKNCG